MLRFSGSLSTLLGLKKQSGISVLSTPTEATVFLNSQEVGKTPYENNDLAPEQYLLKLEKDGSLWQGEISLNEGTVTIVNRDLSKDQTSQAGETLTLRKGKGLTVISNPKDASLEVDGKTAGLTPININLEKGEHTILLSHPNYLKRSIRATLPEGFNLVISADLALSEADLTQVSTPVIKTTPEVVVKNTPTGFLRVRDKAALNGKEIAQVKPGDTLILLEELPGWVRVRLTDQTEGYVSSAYVEKKTTP